MNSEHITIGMALISFIVTVIQTVRLRTFRKIRDTHLNLIWKNSKELSSRLLLKTEEEAPRKACGDRAQRNEEFVAVLIVNIFNLKRKKIEKWYENQDIDEYDYNLLKKLTRS